MSAARIIGYILAGILIFFGVLFIWAAFGETFNSGWLVTGLVTVIIGFGIIAGTYLLTKRAEEKSAEEVILKIDLPADVNLDTLTCNNCGGSLTMDNIKMVAGAPVVSCPYCGTTYQLKEDPKW